MLLTVLTLLLTVRAALAAFNSRVTRKAGVDKIMKSLQTLGWDSHNRLFVVLMTEDEFNKEFPAAADGKPHKKLEQVQLQNELLHVDQSDVYKSHQKYLKRGFWIVDGAHRSVIFPAGHVRPCCPL